MPVREFLKRSRYKIQVRNYAGQVKKMLNRNLDAENDYTLATLTAPDEYKPHEVKKIFKKSLKKFPRSVADILLEENKKPKDIGYVNLAQAFNEYFIDFAKRESLKQHKIKKDIGL